MNDDHPQAPALDDRLRRAFGAPPDFARLVPAESVPPSVAHPLRAVTSPRRRRLQIWTVLLGAAAVIVGCLVIAQQWREETRVVLASALWSELDPITGCNSPSIDSAAFARHCQAVHGAPLQLVAVQPGRVLMHGPRRSEIAPEATVLTMVFGSPYLVGGDIRLVVLGRDLEVEAVPGIKVFHRSLHGIEVFELTAAPGAVARGLPLIR